MIGIDTARPRSAAGVDPRPDAGAVRRRSPAADPLVILTPIGLGALTVATWPLLLAAAQPQPLLLPTLAHVSGMLAGYGVLVLLVLMSRAPRLERGLGADVLARWHAWGGRVVVVLVLVHAWAATVAWVQARPVPPVVAVWEVLTMPALPAATLGTALLLVAAGVSVRAARRRVQHETWHGLHLLMYAAVALSFGHQLAGPDLAGHRVLQVAWALAYTHVFALVLQHRVLTPLRQAARHRLRVAEVRGEGPGVVSIVVGGRHLEELEAEGGQFFRWRFLTRQHWRSAHPFSLSAPPTASGLRLSVKSLGDGSGALQDVAVGTRVLAEGPYGAVTSARRTRPGVLLVAGGVGITPMRALFESLPPWPGEDVLLVYRARDLGEVLFRDELDAIAARRGARVHYLLGPTGDQLSAGGLLQLVPDLAQRDVYLCGPPRLASAVRRSLREAGLPRTRLHEERFDL